MGYRLSRGWLVLLVASLLALPALLTLAGAAAQARVATAHQAVPDPEEEEELEEPGGPQGPALGPDWEPDPSDPSDPSDPGDFDPEPQEPILPPMVTTKTVAGKLAMLRIDGKAAIPRGVPKRVRNLIRLANRIIGKPYKWGGGHAKLNDRGYDCSGAVSYALIKAGMLRSTMVSGAFRRWGAAGKGRWITVYARKSHVYLEVAGLRLDTSSVGDFGERKGVRWRPAIGQRSGFTARHPVRL